MYTSSFRVYDVPTTTENPRRGDTGIQRYLAAKVYIVINMNVP